MVFEDKALTCQDCGSQFIFTAGEQGFFVEKGLMNEPKRCPECRSARRRRWLNGSPREEHPAVCAMCGIDTTVPFIPKDDRPVYCGSCFGKARAAAF